MSQLNAGNNRNAVHLELEDRWKNPSPFKDLAEFLKNDDHNYTSIHQKALELDPSWPELYDKSLDLRRLELEGDFENVSFRGCNLEGFKAKNCTFLRCDFSQVSLLDAKVRDCSFHACDFSFSTLINSDFEAGSLVETNFDMANLHRARFTETYLDSIGQIASLSIGQMLYFRRVLHSGFVNRGKRTAALAVISRIFLLFLCWLPTSICPKEYRRFSLLEAVGNFEMAIRLFSELKINFSGIGDAKNAKICEHFSKRATVLSPESDGWDRFRSACSILFGNLRFGRHLLVWSTITIIAFAFIYKDNPAYAYVDEYNICSVEKNRCVDVENLASSSPNTIELTTLVNLDTAEALYFSAVTFATLGYGDLSTNKHPGIGKWSWFALINAAEALLGATLMALFVAAMIRGQE